MKPPSKPCGKCQTIHWNTEPCPKQKMAENSVNPDVSLTGTLVQEDESGDVRQLLSPIPHSVLVLADPVFAQKGTKRRKPRLPDILPAVPVHDVIQGQKGEIVAVDETPADQAEISRALRHYRRHRNYMRAYMQKRSKAKRETEE